MDRELRYIELKSGYEDDGPAWIGFVTFSKSRRTLFFNGLILKKNMSGKFSNCYEVNSGDLYWVSTHKPHELGRHGNEGTPVKLEAAAFEEFLKFTGRTELDPKEFVVAHNIVPTDPATVTDREIGPERRPAFRPSQRPRAR